MQILQSCDLINLNPIKLGTLSNPHFTCSLYYPKLKKIPIICEFGTYPVQSVSHSISICKVHQASKNAWFKIKMTTEVWMAGFLPVLLYMEPNNQTVLLYLPTVRIGHLGFTWIHPNIVSTSINQSRTVRAWIRASRNIYSRAMMASGGAAEKYHWWLRVV